MEIKKLLKEEIELLININSKRQNIINNLGSIDFEIINLENQKNLLKEEIKLLKIEEDNLGLTLQQKYGNGSIDIDKEEITILG